MFKEWKIQNNSSKQSMIKW